MRRILSILKFFGRTVLLVAGVAAIVFLANLALHGTRELIARVNANQLHQGQQAVFPGTATAIGFLNATVVYQNTHAPSPTITPTESDNPDTAVDGSGSTGDSGQPGQLAATARPIPTEIVQPAETLAPTMPSVPSPETPTLPPAVTEGLLDAPKTLSRFAQVATNTVMAPPATNTKRPSPSPIPETDTPTATSTVPPTLTAIPTNTALPTVTATVTVVIPTATAATTTVATVTIAAATVQAAQPITPTLGPTSKLPVVVLPGERTERPQPTAIPTHAPRVKTNGNDILNILLIGSDTDVEPSDPSFRTDSMVIVSINRTANSVSMLSVARDLYVYIPSLGMNRINTAFQWGEAVHWNPGGGFGLLQQTILYNLGIPVHYYAIVSFEGFKKLVDTFNGVDVAVDCPISDLRFQGQYDEKQTPVYSPFTLNVGYYHMNGSLALWYSRSRNQTSDFDRSRRQQQVLRAIWRTARDQGLIAKAPELWGQLTEIVKTNLQLPDVLGLVPMALNLNPGSIGSYVMQKGYETKHWRTPAGEDVQLPDPEGFFQTINDFYTPPTSNRLGADVGQIEVINGTGKENWDKVAADRLGWEGFNAQAKGPGDATAKTVIYDYTGSAKPGTLSLMAKALNVRQDRVVSQPDPNRTVDFRVVLGADYNSCSAPGFAK